MLIPIFYYFYEMDGVINNEDHPYDFNLFN